MTSAHPHTLPRPRRKTAWAIAALVPAMLLVVSCDRAPDPTRIVLAIGTDYEIPSEANRVTFRRFDAEGSQQSSQSHTFDLEETGAPFSFSVLPGSNETHLYASLSLYRGDAPLVERRVAIAFQPDTALSAAIHLGRACEAFYCESGQTCRAGQCVSPSQVDVQETCNGCEVELSGLMPAPTEDAGTPLTPDSGPEPVTPTDAGPPDAGPEPSVSCDPPRIPVGEHCRQLHVESLGAGQDANVLVASDGTAHVFYTAPGSGRLVHAQRMSDGWSDATLSNSATFRQAAFGADGDLYVAFYSTLLGEVRMIRHDGSDWIRPAETVTLANPASDIYVRPGAGGTMAMLFYDRDTASLRHVERSVTGTYSLTSVTAAEVDPPAGAATIQLGFDVDDTGTPWFSYRRQMSGDLGFGHNSGASWVVASVTSSDDIGHGSRLAIGPDGEPEMLHWNLTENALAHTYLSGARWVTDLVADLFPTPAVETSWNERIAFAIDAHGTPHALVAEGNRLAYATRDGDTWIHQRLADGLPNMQSTSLAIDASGAVHGTFIANATLYYLRIE